MKPWIQIAGIRSLKEAKMLVSSGVSDLGFPLGSGVRTPDLSELNTRAVIREIGPQARCVLITYLSKADEIRRLALGVGASGVQLHGDITAVEVEALRKGAPSLFLIKSLIVGKSRPSDLGENVAMMAPWVDAFLLDTYDRATGASGATGKRHDWQLSHDLVHSSPKSVILAGGLNPSNVALAIRTVRPAGVDAHSGVEDSQGNKDPFLVKQFVEESTSAFKALVQ